MNHVLQTSRNNAEKETLKINAAMNANMAKKNVEDGQSIPHGFTILSIPLSDYSDSNKIDLKN